eukprot:Nk52_evm26s232 gene=Nk52_evmTU26s232
MAQTGDTDSEAREFGEPLEEVFMLNEIRQRGYYSEILDSSILPANFLDNISRGPKGRQTIHKRCRFPSVDKFASVVSKKLEGQQGEEQAAVVQMKGVAQKSQGAEGGKDAPGGEDEFQEIVDLAASERAVVAVNSSSNGALVQANDDPNVPPTKAVEPKVLLPYKTESGTTPRKIEIERRKRAYAQIDIDDLLANEGLDTTMFLPGRERYNQMGVNDINAQFPTFLSLDTFDNEDHDCRTPEEWISLGTENGIKKFVPAKGLYVEPEVRNGKESPQNCPPYWKQCKVLSYVAKTRRYEVEWMTNGEWEREQLPRLFVFFNSEDPHVFAQRMVEAYESRERAEALLRYNLYIDCMPTDDLLPFDKAVLDQIIYFATGKMNLEMKSFADKHIGKLAKELKVEFARVNNQLIFDSVLDKGKQEEFGFVTRPEQPIPVELCQFNIELPEYNFRDQYNHFLFSSFLTKSEVINAITKARIECNKVIDSSLFNVNITKSVRLDEYEQMQTQTYVQTHTFLREHWVASMKNLIKNSLKDVGKGWFNMNEKNKEIYEITKLQKFMNMIKFLMQDALRYLCQDSIRALTKLLEDVASAVMSADNLEWPNDDLRQSPFKPPKNPLFLLDLLPHADGFRFSTQLHLIEQTTMTVFDKALSGTQNIPQLEPLVMEDLFWATNPSLETVHENEPLVNEYRERLRAVIRKALIPLTEYAKKYDKYLDLYNLNISEYLIEFGNENSSFEAFEEAVAMHIQEKEIIEKEIPQHISIGLFWVNCENIRNTLSRKRGELCKQLLQLLAQTLRKKNETILGEYKMISRKLFERCNSIEEVTEQRAYIETIPETTAKLHKDVETLMVDYDRIAALNYPLDQEDFDMKWEAFGWYKKVDDQIEETEEVLATDSEKFQKNCIADKTNLEERLEQLHMIIAGFSQHQDIAKAQDISNEVKKLSKQLKECQQNALLINQREQLFGLEVTEYDKLAKLTKDFEPYKNLWVTTADWLKWKESWMTDPFTELDPEAIEKQLTDSWKTMFKSVKHFKDLPGCLAVASQVKEEMDEFKPNLPLIISLRNPGMRERHWKKLSDELGFELVVDENLTFSKLLEFKLQDHIEEISKVGDAAGKEYAIESALDKMEREWQDVNMEILEYRETGTYVMKISEEGLQLLDDHIVMTQSMSFSPFKKVFEDRLNKWEMKLKTTQDVMDEWAACQRSWLYLEPIFSSEDINRQLPTESKRYQTMDKIWRKIMNNAHQNPNVITFCPDGKMLDSFRECNKLLELVQKGLSEYLETKRASFPRFYFLSDDELLEILSQTKDPKAVQPHLRKCFENIASLEFQEDLQITAMYSGEGEKVDYSEKLYPTGNVEDWLLEVENVMRNSLQHILKESLDVYPTIERTDWVTRWPGQIVINGSQVYWTAQVTMAIEEGVDGVRLLYADLVKQLEGLVELVRGDLHPITRMAVSALIVIDVHGRDVVAKLVNEKVEATNDFEWISQLRSYWEESTLKIKAVNAVFPYGYEYLGNNGRLVITPLTDRCYLTLTGAIHLNMGGAPAGPAGTGKTETSKDLAKVMAKQCVVFNCSDQLDYISMGKFFKGVASAGAWSCFDEFNRIEIEVLSVVAQQISTIQKALNAHLTRFVFEGVELALKPFSAIFITMNPGYAGRTELPDNLKALFRPVAMMVPDYGMIAEIMLFSFGFSDARILSFKITSTFKLSSEQLSSQDHYDFGMRAVKSVISAAGNIKREGGDVPEDLIVLRALREVNVPKFLSDDLLLFNGIISDLFPGRKPLKVDYASLEKMLLETSTDMNLKPVEGFMTKCIQLFETTVVRHGLMLVGPTGSGKTMCYKLLAQALCNLKQREDSLSEEEKGRFQKVQQLILNPKSITMGQLYGEFDLMTHEWTDGILSCIVRQALGDGLKDHKWVIFDGPVDAVWIENMNTVLDDNKKLCLSSGEIIKLSDEMRMIFEVEDLAVASPATVSRCGMVYLEPSVLGVDPFVECWFNTLHPSVVPFRDQLSSLFSNFLSPCLQFLRENLHEPVPTVNGNLTFSLIRLMDCFFQPFEVREGYTIPEEKIKSLPKNIEPWFVFSLIWSIGTTCGGNGWELFDAFLRPLLAEHNIVAHIPASGLVYDYRYDDETNSWVGWMDDQPEFKVDLSLSFADIIVPTVDTVRYSYLLHQLITNNQQVMMVGPTGTGKTLTVSSKLMTGLPPHILTQFLAFSARTSANQTQDLIDSKLDKRRKGIFGPPIGKKMTFFVDDLNMPALETYGAQPPIELLRQWMDHDGWYDRKVIGTFKEIVDVNFVCAMGPPGGGRNPITNRMTRHFNVIYISEMNDSSKTKIFGTILNTYLKQTQLSDPDGLTSKTVQATINVYATIAKELLPTPAKSHYTFNLRDLSKVFQGILMSPYHSLSDEVSFVRLWVHENQRIFQDRLINKEDKDWFNNLLNTTSDSLFEVDYQAVLGEQERLFYGDFMTPGAENREYLEVTDFEKLPKVLDEYLDDYNATTTAPMKLVLFMDAVGHLCRISRVLRQPQGNALLLGVGGSGRASLSKLAAYMADYECFQIELSKNYGNTEWKDDLKKILLKAGAEDKPIVFIFADTQIKRESFLEDVNSMLNGGDVPNLLGTDDMEVIGNAVRPILQQQGITPTKTNTFNQYLKRVKANLHVVLCMSPIGDIFRARLRMFPALVNCCTIDWFSEWPKEALISVAKTFLSEVNDLTDDPAVMNGLVNMCNEMHLSVSEKSKSYLSELGRHNYVTPTSYLQLLAIFSKLIGKKKSDIRARRNRTAVGLEKLLTTAKEVELLQSELEVMRPMLEQAAKETEEAMVKISADKVVAEETKTVVAKEEEESSKKAEETKAIADDAQRDLDEALPALDAALQSLKSLNRNDVVEVRTMQRPPPGVKLVVEAVCIMKALKPKRIDGPKPGTKVDDYWDTGKGLLTEPQKFLDSLFAYDKENIPEAVIQKIQPYIDSEDFQPTAIAKVSKACTSLCMWVRAMHKYYLVTKLVAPKRAALKEAQDSLEVTLKLLNDAKERLRGVEMNIKELERKYNESVAKKDELQRKCGECTLKLQRAEKLIGALGDERTRWQETVDTLDIYIFKIVGDVVVGAGGIAYLGPFTAEYRAALIQIWSERLEHYNVPHSEKIDITAVLGDPVQIRSWQIFGLPRDSLSTDNGVIVANSERWPLFIDPQGQANKWIKAMEKEAGLDIIKLSDRDFLRNLENAVRFGKPCLLENVGEELDPALESILLRQTFKQGGSTVIKMGDSVIPYHEEFKFYITTKLPNPHYTPEISTKVTLINFTLSESGLEDQLLALVVAEERPDLEEAKNQLIVSNAKMQAELKEIEDKILNLLSAVEGSPVDDERLIATLEASKKTSEEIKAKVQIAEQTEKDIDVTRSKYIPVAVRTSLMFFCISDLANIDPMYQYSLPWFVNLFVNGINNADKSTDVEERIANINEYFTFSLYTNVCRSLFEKHKMLFAFLLCVRILMNRNMIDMEEWSFLLSGGAIKQEIPNPDPSWVNARAWNELMALNELPNFSGIASTFHEHIDGFKNIFDSATPQTEPLPGKWGETLNSFQRLLVLRCLRAGKVTNAMQLFVAEHLGQRFIEPQTTSLADAYKDSTPSTPLIFVLSAGTDPASALFKFAAELKFTSKLTAISLGQGQGPRAEALFREAYERGLWVFFQNCHLSPSWMPSLERIVENIEPDKVHRDFRMWLTSMPSKVFPVSILQNGVKMTVEPPRGIKANLMRSYAGFDNDFLNSCTKHGTDTWKKLLFSLSLFHASLLERRKFGSLGFNIAYDFTDGDRTICISQLKMFLDEYDDIPYKVLTYTAGHINYGGRVTDDWDRRCLMNILADYYSTDVLADGHTFSESGIYYQIEEGGSKEYDDYIKELPINDTPEIFGLHNNADITFAQNETFALLEVILTLQPRKASGGGRTMEDIVEEAATDILSKVAKPFDVGPVMEKYPVQYNESMNTVLTQELVRYNKLLSKIHSSLEVTLKALKGLVVMSGDLEKQVTSMVANQVPQAWASRAYPSLKPLASWVIDLVARIDFIKDWIDNGIPKVFWISGFFFPQAFLTGTLQNFARKYVISIDTVSFDFKVLKNAEDELTSRPADGCYIQGLFAEGARWDSEAHVLTDSRPKELFTTMPIIWLVPVTDRVKPTTGIYDCPVYKTLTRAGTLSTTGHSTNYVLTMEIPSDKPQNFWIKRGVALLCALDF